MIGFDIDSAMLKLRKARTVALPLRVVSQCQAIIIAVYSGEQAEALFSDIETPTNRLMCTRPARQSFVLRRAPAAMLLSRAPISGTSAEAGRHRNRAGRRETVHVMLSAGFWILCPTHLRGVGDASRAKLAINLILQNNRAALAEGIVFAERMGLDGPTFLATARQSAAYSRVMDTKGEKMLSRDFWPQSHLTQTLKDAELILKEAARQGLRLPVTAAQADLLREAIAILGPDSDSAAIIEAIRQRNVPAEVLR